MAALKLRTPEDVRRLFSALGDEMTHEALSVADVDQLALYGSSGLDETDSQVLGLSMLVAMASAWTAIEGFKRNSGSMLWGIGWGLLGFLFPVPAVVFSAVTREY